MQMVFELAAVTAASLGWMQAVSKVDLWVDWKVVELVGEMVESLVFSKVER